ncbi:MAG: serine/threonine-protein kinase [Acidobacteriota bacterium]
MTPDRWQRIEQLFKAALELETAERAAFLQREGADDPDVAQEVERLLSADEDTHAQWVNQVVQRGAREVIRHADRTLLGQRIGPWMIKERLGQGGMSTVYLALRADQQFKKRAALKVIKRGMDSDEILQRFRNERQILASLEHPNIARLIDGGSTEEGMSYFVMEYVEGVPIDQYCDTRRLGLDDRLDLFRAVGEAISYAHRNLVVHRDLKPSNILVSPDGTPKLLDFGIAKLLNPELGSGNLEPTVVPLRIMTPSFASPEQLAGEPVTTASDVYSLGVILYQMLCGRRPYRISGSPSELEHQVRHVEPEPPSAALRLAGGRAPMPGDESEPLAELSAEEIARRRDIETGQLTRRLTGDLDAIALTALRKEPQRRYASVDHLLDDLKAHQAGLPIAARKDSFSYQAGKFLRRYRFGATTAAVMLCLVVALVAVLAVQSVRLGKERTVSEQQRARAEAVSEFLVDLFQVAEPGNAQGTTITANELLDRGADRVGSELADQPELQATLLHTIGRVYQQLGLYDQAVPRLERALTIRRGFQGPMRSEVAESLNYLAVTFAKAGAYDRAEPYFREALEVRRALYGETHQKVLDSVNNLALLLHEKGDYTTAEELYREALRLGGERAAGDTTVLSNLALLLFDRGAYGEAEELYRRTLRQIEAETPQSPVAARVRSELGMTLFEQGRLDEAENVLRRAVEQRRTLLGSQHPDLALSLRPLATVLVQRGELEEAIALHTEALAIRRQVGPDHPQVADSLAGLAEALAANGDPEQAQALLGEALTIYRQTLPAVHPFTAEVLSDLGRLLCDGADLAGAAPLLEEALEIRRQSLPADDPRTAESAALWERCSTQG